MIKVNATVAGSVTRAAQQRTDKNGQEYMSLVMSTQIPSQEGEPTAIEVLVILREYTKADLDTCQVGSRIEVAGNMNLRKKQEEVQYYLDASRMKYLLPKVADKISGEMEFTGRMKKDGIVEERQSKAGQQFRTFSAYSYEKVGQDEYTYIWVDFARFLEKEAAPEPVPEWLTGGVRIKVKGQLRLHSYNGRVKISCRISEIEQDMNNKTE